MKTVIGKVVQVNTNTQVAKKDGGSYPGWQLIYSTPEGKVETIAKHLTSLKRTPSIASALNSLAPNDDFTMEMEKGDAGFWEVVSLRKGNDMPSTASEGQPAARKYTTDRSSTYETPEERSLRQTLIVRQSAISSAIAATPGGEIKTILKRAEQIEDHVWRNLENKKFVGNVAAGAAPEVE